MSALLKGIECIMVCLLVDNNIPDDRNGYFCMCALASAESLLAVAARMAYPVRKLYHSIDQCI